MAGKYDAALTIQDRLVPLQAATFIEPGVVGAKYGLSVLERMSDEVRLPLVPATEPTKKAIRAAMVHAGVLNA